MRRFTNTFLSCYRTIIVLLVICFKCSSIFGQTPPSKNNQEKLPIVILDDDYIMYKKTDSGDIRILVGHVKMTYNADTFYADSAVIYQAQNTLNAYGNVAVIQQDGTTAYCDYLRYIGATKMVYMKKNVILSDVKDNHLWSDDVAYNMTTKVGEYFNGGKLVTGNTTVTSNYGKYNLNNKDAYFKGKVVITNPEYNITSEEINYNTESELAVFTVPSVVTNNKSVLKTHAGYYNAKSRLAHFTDRSTIESETQFIVSDTLNYDRNTGWGIALGNVIAIDRHQKLTLYSDYAQYNELTEKLWAYKWPVFKIESDSEQTRYFKVDTFFSEPIANLQLAQGSEDSVQTNTNNFLDEMQNGKLVDSAQWQNGHIEGNGTKVPKPQKNTQVQADTNTEKNTAIDRTEKEKNVDLSPNEGLLNSMDEDDTTYADTSALSPVNVFTTDSVWIADSADKAYHKRREAQIKPNAIMPSDRRLGNTPVNKDGSKPRYFVGYYHVLMFSDSAQGKCDSVRYSESDSLLRMYVKPVLWTRNSQIKGDTIYALLDSQSIHEVYIPKNGIIISRSGPEKAQMYDQIQGNKIHAFFQNNEIDSLLAYPNASTIYYSKNDSDEYSGVSEASADRMRIQFKKRQISRIYYFSDFKQKMTPMVDVDPTLFQLTRFEWLEPLRPKSLADLLLGATEFQKEQLLGKDYKTKSSTQLVSPQLEKLKDNISAQPHKSLKSKQKKRTVKRR